MKHFTVEQANELQVAVCHGDTDSKFFRRVQSVYWRSQGRKLADVASLSGYSEPSIIRLCAKYRSGGLNALRAQYETNNRKLSFAEEEAALNALAGVAAVGRYMRVQELLTQFAEKTGVTYQIDAFYRLLWRHGWRKVMPRGQHPKKASEEAIEASKKLTP